MLDNEVKSILKEQFSMDTNYKIIMNNINKKQISYNKVFKIALLPTCAAVIAAIIIPNLNNKPDEFAQGIAKVNTIENIIITEQDNNTMVEIAKDNEVVETNNKEETPTTQVETGKNSESKDSKTNEKNIFGTFEMSANWAKDPLVPENIIEMSKNCAVIKAKIISVGEAKFLNEKDPSPYTPVEVEIEEILDGTLEKGNKTIYVEGGEIKVSEVLKTLNEAEKEKMGLNKISEDEANNMFIIYETEEDYKMELGNEYILVLSNKDNSIVMANGYGIFVEEDGSIINVLTGNKLDIKR